MGECATQMLFPIASSASADVTRSMHRRTIHAPKINMLNLTTQLTSEGRELIVGDTQHLKRYRRWLVSYCVLLLCWTSHSLEIRYVCRILPRVRLVKDARRYYMGRTTCNNFQSHVNFSTCIFLVFFVLLLFFPVSIYLFVYLFICLFFVFSFLSV